jgi:hypothetical protein
MPKTIPGRSKFRRPIVAELVRVRGFSVETRPKSHDFGYDFGMTESIKTETCCESPALRSGPLFAFCDTLLAAGPVGNID